MCDDLVICKRIKILKCKINFYKYSLSRLRRQIVDAWRTSNGEPRYAAERHKSRCQCFPLSYPVKSLTRVTAHLLFARLLQRNKDVQRYSLCLVDWGTVPTVLDTLTLILRNSTVPISATTNHRTPRNLKNLGVGC